jgi:hypothetical protein
MFLLAEWLVFHKSPSVCGVAIAGACPIDAMAIGEVCASIITPRLISPLTPSI